VYHHELPIMCPTTLPIMSILNYRSLSFLTADYVSPLTMNTCRHELPMLSHT